MFAASRGIPSSGVEPEKRGTYAGLIEKIPYLQDLGVTAVELLPIFQFDHQEAPPGLVNYWGYNPVSFFAPHNAVQFCHDPLAVLNEFRDMVKALHRAGIEVILDVVYNHTAEGNDKDRHSASKDWRTRPITSCKRTTNAMPTTVVLAIHSTPIIRWCAA